MISSLRHLSRSAPLHNCRVSSSVAPISSFSSVFGGNAAAFTTTTSNGSPTPKDKGHDLTKADLAQIIAAEHDLKLAESSRIVDTLLDTIVEVVSKKGTVSISGFGKFSNRKVEAREYRNPITGEKVFKGDKNVPKFKAFTNFKDCVEGTKSVKKLIE